METLLGVVLLLTQGVYRAMCLTCTSYLPSIFLTWDTQGLLKSSLQSSSHRESATGDMGTISVSPSYHIGISTLLQLLSITQRHESSSHSVQYETPVYCSAILPSLILLFLTLTCPWSSGRTQNCLVPISI
jgi:hypothetical protein